MLLISVSDSIKLHCFHSHITLSNRLRQLAAALIRTTAAELGELTLSVQANEMSVDCHPSPDREPVPDNCWQALGNMPASKHPNFFLQGTSRTSKRHRDGSLPKRYAYRKFSVSIHCSAFIKNDGDTTPAEWCCPDGWSGYMMHILM